MDGAILGRATAAEQNAAEWRAYAAELEHSLLISRANKAGMEALKNALITELSKVDPKNYLFVQQNRQRIFDGAFDSVVKKGLHGA
ncbi:hypothetical protein [Burkholderia ubonensis]|uniref:Uncharacterized protein n=1 Tax=Burkholderia ubonensis subsp. mesacidophila TaxID=265293 RepID=A0A2A4FBW3_9BURK|nr:hypothetical protein [Burkholderia ubonensis]PCE30084.1 hypothetical protein BZL54_23245 [Burkholderia ubonensis subsp. mesacidophila]